MIVTGHGCGRLRVLDALKNELLYENNEKETGREKINSLFSLKLRYIISCYE